MAAGGKRYPPTLLKFEFSPFVAPPLSCNGLCSPILISVMMADWSRRVTTSQPRYPSSYHQRYLSHNAHQSIQPTQFLQAIPIHPTMTQSHLHNAHGPGRFLLFLFSFLFPAGGRRSSRSIYNCYTLSFYYLIPIVLSSNRYLCKLSEHLSETPS